MTFIKIHDEPKITVHSLISANFSNTGRKSSGDNKKNKFETSMMKIWLK